MTHLYRELMMKYWMILMFSAALILAGCQGDDGSNGSTDDEIPYPTPEQAERDAAEVIEEAAEETGEAAETIYQQSMETAEDAGDTMSGMAKDMQQGAQAAWQ